MTRRELLTRAAWLLALMSTSNVPGARALRHLRFSSDPFTLGVASGDPLPDGVVLWTRLAPEPLAPTGTGLPAEPIEVQWVIARDEAMTRTVRTGTALALPEFAHSVHVEVEGLEPDRVYFYQFRVGDASSPVGRTRTAPARDAIKNRLRLAFASCANYQQGFFGAYRGIANEDLELVLHLGDYIYEGGPDPSEIRQFATPNPFTLEQYRQRHAQYKLDPDLQAAHAAHPWIVTWDDHEVEDNYASEQSRYTSREAFMLRRAAAYRAYYEHMPLRRSSLPQGPNLELYRRLTWGNLAEFSILDTRQYRSDQPCGDGLKARCAEAISENQTMTGPAQERWLLEGLNASQTRWNLIGQQVMMAQYDFLPGFGQLFNMDQWDGYVAARNRILRFLEARKPSNPVVLTGDIHSSWVHDLKLDFDNPNSSTVGTEFVGTSVTSDFIGAASGFVQAALRDNPHTKYFDGSKRGYVRCELTSDRMNADFRSVSSVYERNASMTTTASFVVEGGQAGAKRA